MTALTTREALKRELQRHIGAHADIVANALLASGAVIDAATLADDARAIADSLERWNETRDSLVLATLTRRIRELTAALTERGTQ